MDQGGVDLGRFRTHVTSTGPMGIHICMGPVLSDSPCTPPSASRETEHGFGVNSPGGLQGRKSKPCLGPSIL